MAAVKWVKITTDMFDNRKIKHLRKLPEGNNIVLIWVMLLTMAGRCNASGLIFLTENIPYTPKMLADELGFEENTVKLALEVLERFEMITTNDEHFLAVAGWEEHQSAEEMERIREQTRQRVARHRAKQKLLLSNVTGNVTEHYSNAIEEDKEEDIDIYKYIVGYLNEKLNAHYKVSSKKTKTLIRARLNEGFTKDDFVTVIDKKCAEWMGDEKMEKYLRPETLFGTKFESYLNAKTTKRQQVNTGVPVGAEQNDLDDVF